MFKINCEKVGDVGEKFKEESEKVKEIYLATQKLEQEISEIWKGGDSYNFRVSFKGHNNELTHIVAFLKNHSELLKQCSETHNELDEDFGSAMSS